MVRNKEKSKKNFLNFCLVDRPEMNPKWPEVKAVTMKEKWKKHQFTRVCVKPLSLDAWKIALSR